MYCRYPTFCAAAGLSTAACADDSPTPPKAVDPARGLGQDIYGTEAWPGLDGVNVWPLLIQGSALTDIYAAHPTIVVSAQVILHREHKLLLGQGDVPDSGPKTFPNGSFPTDGWHEADGTWTPVPDTWTCGLAWRTLASPFKPPVGGLGTYGAWHFGDQYTPCLFNETGDMREKTDLSTTDPTTVATLWAMLNRTLITSFASRSPSNLLGPCNEKCAREHWGGVDGPICGVPGCAAGPPPPSPSAPSAHGKFLPVENRTNCTWIKNFGSHDGARDSFLVESHTECCAKCFASDECVLATFTTSSTRNCFLHDTTTKTKKAKGVTGCITGRMPLPHGNVGNPPIKSDDADVLWVDLVA